MEYSAMRCDGICGHTAFFMYKTAKGALKFSAGNGMMIYRRAALWYTQRDQKRKG